MTSSVTGAGGGGLKTESASGILSLWLPSQHEAAQCLSPIGTTRAHQPA